MSELEKYRDDSIARRSGALERAKDSGLLGEPITYQPRHFNMAQSWSRLKPSMQQWAQGVAGDIIRDPHTGIEQRYWACDVRRPSIEPGPSLLPVSASYKLWVFGKGGLAVAYGTSDRLVDAPGATPWKSQGWALSVDGSRVRSAHTSSGRPNTKPATTTQTDSTTRLAEFIPTNIAPWFGNLPVETQRFLVEPFQRHGREPQKADLDALIDIDGIRCNEMYSCYLFNGKFVSFVHATRSVPYVTGAVGTALWNASSESERLQRTPWSGAAWTAPVVTTAEADAH